MSPRTSADTAGDETRCGSSSTTSKRTPRHAEKRRELPGDYYLQPVVVLRRDDGTWELVDGQQRLTTLFLITKYIATKFSDATVEYGLTYETRDQEGHDSRRFLETVPDPMRASATPTSTSTTSRRPTTRSSTWFGEQGSAGQAAIDIHSALSEVGLRHLVRGTSRAPNPNELFTRLNRDRIPLTDSELIKALVLSNSGAADGQSSRQQEIAAQWDGFERDLRDDQFWAFLTGSTEEAVDAHRLPVREHDARRRAFVPGPDTGRSAKVWKDIDERGAAAFWRDVVERHGLLTGWYHDRELYHRIGYLVATGDSIPDLIADVQVADPFGFPHQGLVERTRQRLDLTPSAASLLRYDKPKDGSKCTDVLLLMNVETVLRRRRRAGSRFSFHAYAGQGWSLEHIHAQNSQDLKTEKERRDWLGAHDAKIREHGLECRSAARRR